LALLDKKEKSQMTWKQDERGSLLRILADATFLICFRAYIVAEERAAPAPFVVGVRKMPNVTTAKHRDPVCGMTVDGAKAAGAREYQRRTFYFLSSFVAGRSSKPIQTAI
jgi:hypothetical protein